MHRRCPALRLLLLGLTGLLMAVTACSPAGDDRLAIVVKVSGITAQITALEVSAVLNGKLASNSTFSVTTDLGEFVVYLPGTTEGALELDIGALSSAATCQLARAQVHTTVHPAPPRVVELTAALQSASPPLCPLTVNLTGSGSVQSQPGQLACNSNRCRGVFAQGSQVVLTATAGAGSTDQVVWSPACTTPGPSCTLTLSQPLELTALFCSPSGFCQHNAPILKTNLRGVWSGGPNNVWVVGAGATAAHYDGKAWTAVPVVANPSYSFYSVASTGPSDVVIGGSLMPSGASGAPAEGAIFAFNGTSWAQVAMPARTVRDIWLGSATSGRAVGDAGLIYYRSGSSWSGADLTNMGKVYWSAWGTGGTEYVVGTGGFIALASPGTTSVQSAMNSQTSSTLVSVWGTGATDVWAAGYNCTLVHYDGTWTPAPPSCASSTTTLNAVWGSAANDYWAVGDSATILHYNGTAWSAVGSGGTGSYRAVGGSSASDVWIVGDNGVILQRAPP